MKSWLFAAVSSLVLVIAPTVAQALNLSDFRAHPSSDEFYSEQWSLSVWADNGYYVHVQFVVSNLGLGDGKGATKLEVTAPDGARYKAIKALDDNWNVSANTVGLTFGGSTLLQRQGALTLQASVKDLAATLEINPVLPTWDPGEGLPLLRTSDGAYSFIYLAPRAEFLGTLTLKGQTIPIKGVGLVDHSWSTVAPHEIANRWVKFKVLAGDLTCLFTGLSVPGNKGSLSQGWLFLAKGSAVVLATTDTRTEFLDVRKDKKSSSGYQVPHHLVIRAGQPGASAEVNIKARKLLRRKEILKDLGFFERHGVSRVSEPIDYTYNGQFEISAHSDKPAVDITRTESWDYVLQFIKP